MLDCLHPAIVQQLANRIANRVLTQGKGSPWREDQNYKHIARRALTGMSWRIAEILLMPFDVSENESYDKIEDIDVPQEKLDNEVKLLLKDMAEDYSTARRIALEAAERLSQGEQFSTEQLEELAENAYQLHGSSEHRKLLDDIEAVQRVNPGSLRELNVISKRVPIAKGLGIASRCPNLDGLRDEAYEPC
jgi:hypothetical protein